MSNYAIRHGLTEKVTYYRFFALSVQLHSSQFHVVFHTFYNSLFTDFYAIINYIQAYYCKSDYYNIN